MSRKTYSELMKLNTIEERFDYLKVPGRVGDETFGYNRYLNQIFYKDEKWLKTRDKIIARDLGCELGLKNDPDNYEISGKIIVHHIEPITIDMIENNDPLLYDEDNLVCSSDKMHKALHYGDKTVIFNKFPKERYPGDTCPW